MANIDNTQDIIDSCDIINRIEELESILSDAHQENEENHNLTLEEYIIAVHADQSPAHAHQYWEEAEELLKLRKVAEQAEGYGDWDYGEQLIREDHFTAYIEGLIDDCYEMPEQMNSGEWPYRHITIDYEAAAEEAKSDYTEIDFDGVTYLMRA